MDDLYNLMVTVKGQEWIKTFPTETREEAEQRGKRMVETERKKGVVVMTAIVSTDDVADAMHQAHRGEGYDLERIKQAR
ncbi:MAG: hypothetical protein WB660_07500 [Candidatus Sulfotelmatobacter sp.]